MWTSISRAWQIAFEQGWEAFQNGSIPIGAAIADENGNVISFGRNA
jgi:tRNA(Arg) A34 adenosine deaminase TadA